MNEKCSTKGCENEIDPIANFVGIEYCQECEQLLMLASKNKIDVSLCKDKKELQEMLKDKN